jgi:hypothetical protein
MNRLIRCFLWLSPYLATLLFAGWVLSRMTAPAPGSMEDLYNRVRVGMSQEEAVAALEPAEGNIYNNIWVWGTNRQGREFSTPWTFQGMPPPSEVRDALLTVGDCTGEHVEVTLGEGGVVTAKKYLPDDPCQYCGHLLHQTFGH